MNNNNDDYQIVEEVKTYTATPMVLGIVGLVFSILIPLVTYCTAIPGLVISIKRKKDPNDSIAKTGFILSIIALIVSVINSIIGVIMAFSILSNLPL